MSFTCTCTSFFFKIFRSSHPEVFLRKGVLKICNKFKGEHTCRSAISIKLQSNWTAASWNCRYWQSKSNHIFSRHVGTLNTSSCKIKYYMIKCNNTCATRDYSLLHTTLQVFWYCISKTLTSTILPDKWGP